MSDTIHLESIDKVFSALANKHRREIIYLLGLQPYSISKLADIQDLSLPAIHKHIKVLEHASLIMRKKVGRENILALNRDSLGSVQNWFSQYHAYWGNNKESLENYSQYFKKNKNGKGGDDK